MNRWYHEQNVIIDHIPLGLLQNTILSSSSPKAEVLVVDHSCDNIRVVSRRVNNKSSSIILALRMVINRFDTKLFANFRNTCNSIAQKQFRSVEQSTFH